MMFDIAKMPYEIAMRDELARYQFYTNAQKEWVLVPRGPLQEARSIAMEWALKGRVPECGKFGQIAQDLDAMLAAAPPIKTHPAITHCDNCGCDWIDNGLNPIGCPYCKQSEQAIEIETLRVDAARYRLLRKGAVDGVAVVRGLGAMDYGMSAVVSTYLEEIDGDDLDAAIDVPCSKENGND